MITKLKMKNWKCHLDSEIEFTQGTNTILGVMGAGKSSILEAITFALFGTFTSLQQRKIKLEDVIMNKPIKKDYAEVELFFEIDGKKYSVKRRIERRKSTHAELRIDGKLVEVSPQRVTEMIEDILKVDFDLFTRAIYSEQNRIESFLTISKSERKKKIDEVLNIERFEKARATVVSLLNRVKKYRDEKEKIILQLKGETDEDEIKNLEKEIGELNRKTDEMEKRRKEVEEVLKELEKEIERGRKTKMELEKMKNILSRIEGEIELLERETKKEVGNVDELRNKLEKLRNEYEVVGKEIEKIGKEESDKMVTLQKIVVLIKEVEEKIKRLEELQKIRENIEKSEKEKERLVKEIEDEKEKLEEYKNEYYGVKAKIPDLEKHLEELKKAEAVCPVCETPLTEGRKEELIKKRENEIGDLKSKVFSLSKMISEAEKKIKEKEKLLKELEGVIAKKTFIDREISEIEKFIDENKNLKEEREKVEKELDEIREKMKMFKENEKKIFGEIEKVKASIKEAEEIEKKRRELEKKIEERKNVEEKIKAMEEELKKIDVENLEKTAKEKYAEFKSIDTQYNSNIKILEEKKRRYDELKKKIELVEKYKRDVEKLNRNVGDLDKLKTALINTQEELRKNFITAINQAMQSLWNEMYPYGDFQSIRLFVDKDDYVLQLQELDGSWVSVDKVSGGERTLAALTLRMSFALVLAPQVGLLILDEPTHNLDIKAREELAKILRERVSDFIEQTILITHDTIMEDAVSGYLYRIERDKEKNGVSKVVRVEG